MLEITEIIKCADQGMTKPFLCGASDEKRYYVKGKAATVSGLIKEWLGYQFAQKFGLPVPKSQILYVEESLVDAFGETAKNSLGHGYVFGSEEITSTRELKYEQIAEIKEELKKDILLFDLWMRNEDRTLTASGGNPNLRWNVAESSLTMIDHNLILDPDFNKSEFWQTHAFKQTVIEHGVDQGERRHYEAKMQETLKRWSTVWKTMPDEWIDENNASKTIDETFIFQQLEDDAQGNIWTRLP
jgi:hypothetical protein